MWFRERVPIQFGISPLDRINLGVTHILRHGLPGLLVIIGLVALAYVIKFQSYGLYGLVNIYKISLAT